MFCDDFVGVLCILTMFLSLAEKGRTGNISLRSVGKLERIPKKQSLIVMVVSL